MYAWNLRLKALPSSLPEQTIVPTDTAGILDFNDKEISLFTHSPLSSRPLLTKSGKEMEVNAKGSFIFIRSLSGALHLFTLSSLWPRLDEHLLVVPR